MAEARGKHIFLITAFLLIIYVVGLIQVVMELAEGERPLFLNVFLQAPKATNLRGFEKELEEANRLSQTLQPWVRLIQFAVLRDTGDKAIMGQSGWFFYKPGVQYLIEPWPLHAGTTPEQGDVLTAVISFRDQLSDREIQLLAVPAPSKECIYPHKLTSFAKEAKQPVYAHTLKVLSDLKKAGVDVVNLFDVYSSAPSRSSQTSESPLYLAQDTHWSPEGMQLAAQAVAKEILDRGWVKKGSMEYGLKSILVRRQGDILRMMNIPLLDRYYAPEELHCSQVILSASGEPYRDDPNSEILVLGDSYLRIYERDEPRSAGFVSHLAYELKLPLASIVSDGGASTLVRQELSRKTNLLHNKKLVVWEFVDRDIRFGTEGWQKVPLP